MTSTAGRVHQNRVRRVAWRQGFKLHKSRRRDPRAWDYGHFWLIRHIVFDANGNAERVADPENSNARDARIGPFPDLEAVEVWLDDDEREQL